MYLVSSVEVGKSNQTCHEFKRKERKMMIWQPQWLSDSLQMMIVNVNIYTHTETNILPFGRRMQVNLKEGKEDAFPIHKKTEWIGPMALYSGPNPKIYPIWVIYSL